VLTAWLFCKVCRSRFCADRAQHLSGPAKICQSQLQTIYSEFRKFHPNPFTSGGVIAECMNIVEMHHKVFPILGEASSPSKDRVPSKELRERLGIYDIILILQQNRLQWYGHVLQKEDTDWVKKCMEYEVESSRPSSRPKRTWKEVVQEDCEACNLNTEDAMDRGRWKKLIKIR